MDDPERSDSFGESYRVDLGTFSGPLDLLLYLVKQAEVDIHDIPISEITGKYLEYVEVLKVIDVDLAGDFLELAAVLLQIKTKMLLPEPLEEEEEDPRADLVRQLIEYKKFRDAADDLREQAQKQEGKFKRAPFIPAQEAPRDKEMDLEEANLWDLITAFKKVIESIRLDLSALPVRYDEMPQTIYQEFVLREVGRTGSCLFSDLFVERKDRAAIVGLFLAILELVRLEKLRARQDRDFHDIRLYLVAEEAEQEEGEK